MSESKDSWLVKLSDKAVAKIENSVDNLRSFNGQLHQLMKKTDSYTTALEELLENKTAPKKEIIELNKKLRAIKIQNAKLKEEIRQIDKFLGTLDDDK